MSEYTKEQLDEAIKLATEGLASKNAELLKDLKDTQKTLKKFEGIDVDALMDSQKKLKKMEEDKLKAEGEYKKLYDELASQTAKEKETLIAEKEQLMGKLHTTIISNDIANSLASNGIIPELSEAASAFIAPKVAMDDKGTPKVGGKSVKEFVESWKSTPTGKYFFADGNSGGGANGSGTGAHELAKYYDKSSPDYNLTEQAKIAKTDPALHQQLSKS
jgi:hypothetical protein